MGRIIIDLDGICADIHRPWHAWLEREHGFKMTLADQHSFDMERVVPPRLLAHVYKVLEQPGFFRNLPPIAGSLEGVRALFSAGHEIFIVTAAEAPISYKEKVEWVREHLPFITKRRLVMMHEKQLIEAAVFIDDNPKNAKAYRAAWPKSFIAGVRYAYNEKCKAYDLLAEEASGAGWAEIVRSIGATLESSRS